MRPDSNMHVYELMTGTLAEAAGEAAVTPALAG